MRRSKASKTAYVFPGQGSQEVGMGYELYKSSRKARAVFEEADLALGFPLSQLCFQGPEEELRQTINAQPAIMTVSLACLRAASRGWNESNSPAFLAGHSLGEYSALVAADVLDFADALWLVRERGRLMQEAGNKIPGGMAAIIGLDEPFMEEVCQMTGTEISNINCPDQIVISGAKECLARAMDLALERGARRAIPLDVSGAFHSTLMEPATEEMAKAISRLEFRDPMIPIVANATAEPVTTAEGVRGELLRQLTRRVHWRQSVEYMIKSGVSTFVEVGTGQVLASLIRRISKTANVLSILKLRRKK